MTASRNGSHNGSTPHPTATQRLLVRSAVKAYHSALDDMGLWCSDDGKIERYEDARQTLMDSILEAVPTNVEIDPGAVHTDPFTMASASVDGKDYSVVKDEHSGEWLLIINQPVAF